MQLRVTRALAAVAVCVTAGLAAVADGAQAAPGGTPAQQAVAAQATGVIVGYRAGVVEATNLTAAIADADAKLAASDLTGGLTRRLSTGGVLIDIGRDATQAELDAVIAQYRADPSVAYVEPDLVMQALATNDTEYPRQWDLFEATGGMNVEAAWAQSTGQGITVAVIDTGYVTHSDLAGQAVAGYDFISDATNANDGNGRDNNAADPGDGWNNGECFLQQPRTSSWHGTHVAGTIAALTNNSKGIAGIAYNAKVQPVRVLGKCGGTTSDIADAITWASGGSVAGVPANATPSDVINMSLGGQSACSSTYQNAINGAVGRGTTVVVAAGNSNANVSGFTPASCNNVIAVASTSRQGNRAFYSNFGALIDVSAPGGETRTSGGTPTPENGIWSTLNTGDYGPGTENYEPYMGTSMAAPHIAGLVALMQARDGALTPAQIETLIKQNARPLPGTCSGGCGAGIADAARTVAAVGGNPNPGNDFSVAVNPTSRSVQRGSSTTTQVTTAVTSGAPQSVTFSASGLPSGATASFSPASVNSGGGSTATIATTAATPTGTFNVTVAANGGGVTRTATLAITVTAAPGGTGCAALATVRTGTLSSGQAVNLPSFTAPAGLHTGCLDGPNGTDFDLYLQRQGTFGWSTVRSGTTSAPDESFTYQGSAGTYRYRVVAYSGSGAYTAGYQVG